MAGIIEAIRETLRRIETRTASMQRELHDMHRTILNWRTDAPPVVPRATLSGTITAATDEADIVAGGKTILLTIVNDTWVTAGATFDAQRQAIIDGLVSGGGEANGWNAERPNIPVTAVIRTSNTLVTITLTALSAYDITAQEVITATVPAAALTTSVSPLAATPTFTIQPVITSSADYFVDATGGSDSNDGLTEATAWKTISKVNSSGFSPSEIIAFKRGEVWRETLTPPSSGSSGSPITLTAYGSGALPLIDGADLVSGWTLESGTVWKATVTSTVRNVFLDGTRMNQGEEQNTSDWGSVASIGAISTDDWFWDDSANTLYIDSPGGDPDTQFASPGVEAAARTRCIDVNSKNFVTCKTLEAKHSNSRIGEIRGTSDNCIFDGLTTSFAYFDGQVLEDSVSNCTIESGVSFSNGRLRTSGDSGVGNNGHGVLFSTTGDGNLCDSMECYDNAEDGFQVHPSVSAKFTVRNGNFHDNHEDGMDFKSGNVTDSLVEDTVSKDNHIRGVQMHPITGGVKFHRCKFEGNGSINVWIQGNAGSPWEFFSCLIAKGGNPTRNYAGSLKEAIRIEPAGSYASVKIYHTTVYQDVADEVLRTVNADADNVDIRNSVLVTTTSQEVIRVPLGKAVEGMAEQNNLVRNSTGTDVIDLDGSNYTRTEINDGTYTAAEGLGQDTVDADPDFVDAANDDFRLNAASAAVGAGQAGLGVATDVDGTSFASPPNMGCYAGSV